MAQRHPNSLANLKKGSGHLATDPVKFVGMANETRRRRGIIRKATMEAMESGFVTIESKDIELFDYSGNKVEVEFATAKFKVPNYLAIGMKLMNAAIKGDIRATELLINMDENYKNREIKAREKTANAQQGLVDHIEKLAIKNTIELGETTPYEELNREIE